VTGGATAIPEVHRLLQVLGAGRDVLELGSAFGVGAAAIAETARTVVTVEHDPERAAITRERVQGLANVTALEGDWREVVTGTFGLVFADAGAYEWDQVVSFTEIGGFIVKDDLTPGRAIDGDPVREFLLRDPRLCAVELLTTPQYAAIVAVRLA
jgi:predicted O-methyltransferase YrrM